MQFQPTALILSASAQRQHFGASRMQQVPADTALWDFARLGRIAADRPTLSVATRDHRVRRSVAGLLLKAAGVIEPRSSHHVIARG